ncbi:hypothetical protein NZK35_14450 [Stieleria sp. ICT_E10.1]|uniref:hypothetical protein n=1 Tax=Stieleria sedimenti TaxID=2976331 RepID=UPI0021802F5C|nr:hypothetical protein [Stieleria sedimenti]MCS7467850.1 hypothetical protein [Stieleria sedimenti]
MNPYEPSTQSISKRRSTTPHFVVATVAALVGFVVAGLGLVYVTSEMNRRMVSGRRYATYDPELYLFHLSITPRTAQFLAFGVAPCMMALSVYMVFRGVKNRRLNTD